MAVSADLSYRLLAARYVRRQAKQLAEQLDGIRAGEDSEYIHRARVASRRLRAALRMFPQCFKSKQLKRWRKEVRRITRALGDARDKDVQLDFLSGTLGLVTDKACAPGIARLLAQLEHDRESLQPAVLEAVGRLEAGKVLEAMLAAVKKELARAKTEAQLSSAFTCEQTARHILRRLEEMLPYQDSLADPEAGERHHAWRIAAKRLRYTLEISKPVYEGQLDAIVDAAKKVQTLLGEIHDCDVWVEHLDAFAREERRRVRAHFGGVGRFARLQVGIEYLRRERIEYRRQVFLELARYWEQLTRQGVWDNLVRVVEGRNRVAGGCVAPVATERPATASVPLPPKPPLPEALPASAPMLFAPRQKPNGSTPREPVPALAR